ncbi:MAG TPA: emopamil-binding family protein [Ktedonobacterales bacterium]
MAELSQPVEAAAGSSVQVKAARVSIPLSRRRLDLLFIVFFLINLLFITYIVDIEQIIIPDPAHFQYPIWPPAPLVDMVHSYGRSFDPLLLARPPWWKATIWIDALFFGPFYAVALYAYTKGKDWIRIPSIIWASVMMTNVTIILSEEIWGPHASPQLGIVLLLNLPWFLLPIAVIARVSRREHPFTAPAGT